MSPSSNFNIYLVPDQAFTELRVSSVAPRPICARDKHVLVIGGSVTGLTSAWLLLDLGYRVTIISDRYAPGNPRVTGQIAGALWEVPPAVCGQHTDLIGMQVSKTWHQISKRVFTDLYESHPNIPHGVTIPMANFFFTKSLSHPSMNGQVEKMDDVKTLNLPGFRHDPNLIKEHAVNQDAGVEDAYQHLAPVIDTDAYLVWLKQLVEYKGATTLTIQPIKGDLFSQESHLLRRYKADVILNATGLAARELASDPTVHPIRGCLLRVKNDGKRFPKVTEVLAVSNTDTKKTDDIVFIVPRNNGILLLGGSVEPYEEKLDLTLDSDLVKKMRARCENFVPGLKNAELDSEAPLVQGLRPFREKTVRVEADGRVHADGSRSHIVHAYGHGGSGFTLSFGSALTAWAAIDSVCYSVGSVEVEDRMVSRL